MLLRAIQRSFRPLASATQSSILTSAPVPHLLLLRGITTSSLHRNPALSTESSSVPPTLPVTPQTGSLQVATGVPTPHASLALLSALKAQPSQYITIHIHKFPFLVTVGDLVRLPFRLKEVSVGDSLRITHASVLGSRDYTLKGAPYIDESLFECRAVVVEETAEPLRVKEKTKRRQRRIKKVKSKHRYTVLRISELVINDLPQVMAGAAV